MVQFQMHSEQAGNCWVIFQASSAAQIDLNTHGSTLPRPSAELVLHME